MYFIEEQRFESYKFSDKSNRRTSVADVHFQLTRETRKGDYSLATKGSKKHNEILFTRIEI